MSTAAERDSPYVGLEPFSEEDATFFFGRKRDVALIVANVFSSPLTVLYGPSGVGKTSVLQAGVVPSLNERGLASSVHRSSAGDAVPALRAAARDAPPVEGEPERPRREVLFLDEFEDFLHGPADAELAAELARVVTRPGRATSVVLSVREDALAKLDRFEGRVPGILDNVLRLDHLELEAAREAILGPRDRWNEVAYPAERFEVEEALVAAVLDGVPAGAGRVETLLLQLVMARLWEARGQRGPYVLRRETFDELGGVDGIVEDYVTGTLDALDPERQELAAEILEHLVTPSRLRLAQRAGDLAGFADVTEPELSPLLDELADRRILRLVAGSDPADTRYEVHHESLADAVLTWRTRYVTERELAAARRRFRRRLALVLIGAVLLAVLAAVGTYGWTQRQTARSEALSAEALGLLAIDPQAALETALDAVDTKSTDSAENALRATVARSHERGRIGGPGDAVTVLDVAPDGRLLARGSGGALSLLTPTGNVVRTYRGAGVEAAALCPTPNRVVASGDDGVTLISGSARVELRGAPEAAFLVECSRDGSTILVANEEVARVYSGTGRPIARIDAEDLGFVETATLSPNGDLVAVAGPEVTRIARIPGGATATTIGRSFTSLAFSPDSRRLFGGDANGLVRARNVAGAGGRLTLRGHSQPVSDLDVSRDGKLLVSAGTDRVARVWDAVTGVELAVLRGHERALRTARFTGDARTVVTAADDGTARLWEVPVTSVLAGHTGPVVAVAITPDGRRVATASPADDDTVRVWDAATGKELVRLIVPDVSFVAISPNGRRVLTRQSVDGRARLWDVASPRRHVLIPVEEPGSVSFTPDGRRVATAGPGRTIRFFDLQGRAVRSFGAPSRLDEVGSLSFSPQKNHLAVAEDPEGQVVILDATSGSEIAALPEAVLRAVALAFSPDGGALATAEDFGVARVWDARDGSAQPPTLAGHDGAVLAVSFSPDSTLVATAGVDGTVRIWHVDTGVELLRVPGSSVAFARNASVLVVGGPGTTARVIPCRPCGSVSELREQARAQQGG